MSELNHRLSDNVMNTHLQLGAEHVDEGDATISRQIAIGDELAAGAPAQLASLGISLDYNI